MEICDKRTRTVFSPRSEDDFDSDKTTLMRPSLAGTLPTTIVPFSDMMLVELTRTYLIRGVDSECLVWGRALERLHEEVRKCHTDLGSDLASSRTISLG